MTRFSTTSTTPSLDLTPIAVVPSCEGRATRTPSEHRHLSAVVHAAARIHSRVSPCSQLSVIRLEAAIKQGANNHQHRPSGQSPPQAHLDGLDGVFHLKQATFWTEGVDTPIILAAREEHGCKVGRLDSRYFVTNEAFDQQPMPMGTLEAVMNYELGIPQSY